MGNRLTGAPCKGCGGPTSSRNTSGYCTVNRECLKTRTRNWDADHPGRRLENHLKNPALYMLSSSRRRAKRFGVPHTITLEDIQAVMTDTCPILGHPIGHSATGGGPGPWSMSLDRIRPAEGYVPGNIQVISHRANIMKNDATEEELIRFAAWIQVTHGVESSDRNG